MQSKLSGLGAWWEWGSALHSAWGSSEKRWWLVGNSQMEAQQVEEPVRAKAPSRGVSGTWSVLGLQPGAREEEEEDRGRGADGVGGWHTRPSSRPMGEHHSHDKLRGC